MIISSYRYTNEATNKKATVATDGLIRQFMDTGSGRQRFIPLSGGKTEIASRATSPARVVDAAGGDPTVQAYVQMYARNGGKNQLWRITQEKTVGSGEDGYHLFSIKADETDMAWDIPYGDPADGNYVQTYPYNGGDNQLWKVKERPIEVVIFKSQHSQWVLDVPGFEYVTAYIQHYPQNDGFNQMWEIEGNIANPVKLRSVSSGLYLMSSIVLVGNDTLAFQSSGSNSDRQLWKLDFSGTVGTIRNIGTGHFLSVPPGPVTTPTLVQGFPGPGTAVHNQWEMIT